MTDPTLARIEDELQAMRSEMATRDDVARLLAAVERIAGAIRPPASERTVDLGEPGTPEPGCTTFSGPQLIWMPDPTAVTVEITPDLSRWSEAIKRAAETPWPVPVFDEPDPDEDAPIEPPRDMAASIARGLAQAAAGQVIELDPDGYRPCPEGRGGEAWPT